MENQPFFQNATRNGESQENQQMAIKRNLGRSSGAEVAKRRNPLMHPSGSTHNDQLRNVELIDHFFETRRQAMTKHPPWSTEHRWKMTIVSAGYTYSYFTSNTQLTSEATLEIQNWAALV